MLDLWFIYNLFIPREKKNIQEKILIQLIICWSSFCICQWLWSGGILHREKCERMKAQESKKRTPNHSTVLASHHCQFVRFWVAIFHFMDFLSSHNDTDIQRWEQTSIIGTWQICKWKDHEVFSLSSSIYYEKDSSNSKSHYVSTISNIQRWQEAYLR